MLHKTSLGEDGAPWGDHADQRPYLEVLPYQLSPSSVMDMVSFPPASWWSCRCPKWEGGILRCQLPRSQ